MTALVVVGIAAFFLGGWSSYLVQRKHKRQLEALVRGLGEALKEAHQELELDRRCFEESLEKLTAARRPPEGHA